MGLAIRSRVGNPNSRIPFRIWVHRSYYNKSIKKFGYWSAHFRWKNGMRESYITRHLWRKWVITFYVHS